MTGLDAMFCPAGVVVVGASAAPGKLGAAMARSLSTFPGPVLLVNSRNPDPAAGVYASVSQAVAETGTPADLALLGVPAAATAPALAEAAAAGVQAAVVCAGGFREAGLSGAGVEAQVADVVASTGIRLLGPNTSGFLAPPRNLVASFVPGAGEVPPGPVAVVASSGGMLHCIAFLLAGAGVGLHLGVGIGNGLDVTAVDVLDHLAGDPDVRAVALHVEGLADGRRLTDSVDRLAERVPVVALVVGRGDVGDLARSHTGVLTPSWRTTRAALRQAGAVLVDDERELVDAVAALSRTRLPARADPGVAIVSGQAGPMVLLTDRLRSTGLSVPPLQERTVSRLADLLPPLTYQRNPVDTGRPGATFPEVLATVAADPGVDVLAVMGLLEPDAFDLSGAIRSTSDGPIVAVVGGPPEAVAATRAGLDADGVPSFDGVAGAVAGLRALVDDARARAGRVERDEPVRLVVPQSFRVPSGEDEGKELLDWLGLSTPARLACDDRRQARQARQLLRPPLAVKMLEPVVAHKARAGGVRLGVVSEADMEEALDALDRAGAHRYLVEEMIAPGVDLIVGARRDPVFGPIVVIGLGGDEAEALDAVAVRLAPLGLREAAAMLDELPGAGLAGGWASRVEPGAVAGVVATLGALLAAVPELDELEINPLRVTADGRLVALDVVVAGGPEAVHVGGHPGPPGPALRTSTGPLCVKQQEEIEMRLATLRTTTGTVAVRVEDDELIELPYPDVVALLSNPDWQQAARETNGRRHPASGADFDAPVRPAKVVCVGLNYRSHIEEMGRPLPEDPTLFAKFTDTLAGPYDDLVVPAASSEVDWEAELGVVIGRPARNVDETEASACIAGYTVVNDISMRDWQWRTTQWMAGKNFEASTPVGPVLVTGDEVGDASDLELRCDIDGVTVQKARTSDLLFPPAAVVAYVSRITTLRPGDLIATGTPGGVGAGRDPKVFLRPGQLLETTLEGVGSCRNLMVPDPGMRDPGMPKPGMADTA